MSRTPKETAYDEQIFPLMEQIIAICKEHKINMTAGFSLGLDPGVDESLFCTTCLASIDPFDVVGTERMLEARRALLHGSNQMVAITITEGQS